MSHKGKKKSNRYNKRSAIDAMKDKKKLKKKAVKAEARRLLMEAEKAIEQERAAQKAAANGENLSSKKEEKVEFKDNKKTSKKSKKANKKGHSLDTKSSKKVNKKASKKHGKNKNSGVFWMDQVWSEATGNYKTGTLRKHKKGFGFVVLEKPDTEDFDEEAYRDIFIGKDNMKGAMNGDIVRVDMLPEYLWDKSPEGIIDKVVERSVTTVAGRLDARSKYGFVVPEGKGMKEDIFIPGKCFNGANDGDYVVAEITKYPDVDSKAEGKVVEIIGRKGEPGSDILAMIKGAGLEIEFPEEVQAEADAIGDEIDPSEIKNRRDLRDVFTVTIDGADSKDFDDAVSIKVNEKGNWVLGVHIADVTYYVKQNHPLDKEAFERGNSVYLINKVVPMLPKKLSNGICSLNPGVDRLTLTCEMEITKGGKIIEHEIYESVINSHGRLVYDDVSDCLEAKIVTDENAYLFEMEKLARVLMARKDARGSIDFNLEEPVITLDKTGRAVDVRPANRRIANKIIEEFMLLANETVAEHFFWLNVPFIFRVHETPSLLSIQELKTFLKGLNITLHGDAADIKPAYLANILEDTKGKQYENIVNTVILRSMQKASYEVECEGHFGLALQYYCHFTSPIRRYPDLMIHRIIKMILNNQLDDSMMGKLEKRCEAAAEHSSKTERQAIDLEREVDKMKMAEYLENHIGEKYEGIISGVTNFGMYVELDNCIEGLVRLERITDDFYEVEPENYRIIGRGTGRTYALGDKVKIKVYRVNIEDREIDFVLA